MYQLFHEGKAEASVRNLKLPTASEEWGSTGKEAHYLTKLRKLLAKMGPDDQKLVLHIAQKVAKR
jgi:cation transport regulator ChaC